MIEDDARLAAMVGEYLQLNDFSVERVGDGLSGLARLRQAAQKDASSAASTWTTRLPMRS